MASPQHDAVVDKFGTAEKSKGSGHALCQALQATLPVEQSVETPPTSLASNLDDTPASSKEKEDDTDLEKRSADDELEGFVNDSTNFEIERWQEGDERTKRDQSSVDREVEQDIFFSDECRENRTSTEVYQSYPQEASFVYPYTFPVIPPRPESAFQQQDYGFGVPSGMYSPQVPTISPVLVGSPPVWMIPQPQQWVEPTIDPIGAVRMGAAVEEFEDDAIVFNYANPGPPIQLAGENHGPDGCNLFVFHIPNEMTNLDLFNYFSPFGNVISARIMVDTGTGRSRGFGFVSYDDSSSANQAIGQMNGLQLGKKRLKVQLKKDKVSGPHVPPGYGPEHFGGKGKGKGKASRGARKHRVTMRKTPTQEEFQHNTPVESAMADLSLDSHTSSTRRPDLAGIKASEMPGD